MKVQISLNYKKIDNAIKQIKELRNNFYKINQKYLIECCQWIARRANQNILNSGIGPSVMLEIIDSAAIVVKGKKATLKYGEKAAFVEFGVGVVGEGTFMEGEIPCPGLSEWAYNVGINTVGWHRYNIHFKNYDGSWLFKIDDDADLDIKTDNVMQRAQSRKGGIVIRTKGNQASMFFYNAIMDFKSTGEYKRIWEQVKEKYIK